MLSIDYAQSTFGPIAANCALRLDQFKLVASDPEIFRFSKEPEATLALVELKTKGYRKDLLSALEPGSTDAWLQKSGLTTLVLPATDAKKAELYLYLRLGFGLGDDEDKRFFLGKAIKADPKSALPHLRLAEHRYVKDGHGKKDKAAREADFARAWKLGPNAVRAHLRDKLSDRELWRVTGGAEGEPPKDP